jgi:hypothetical protein
MAVGFQFDQDRANQQLGALAVDLRDLMVRITSYHQKVTGLGHAGQVALGFTDADATDLQLRADYINTVAALYYGTAAQPSPFNFDDALSGPRAGR